MASRSSQKSQELAKYLKDHQVERTHSPCPICYKPVKLGGAPLLNHFNTNCRKGRNGS